MSKEWPWIFTRNIDYVDIVSVDIDRLVTNDQFLQLLSRVPHDSDIGVSNVKLVLVLQKELVLCRLFLVKLDEEHTKLLHVFISEEIKKLGLSVVDDLLDVGDFEGFLQVDKLASAMVVVDTVVHRGDDGDSLIVVHVEELWLSAQWLCELH